MPGVHELTRLCLLKYMSWLPLEVSSPVASVEESAEDVLSWANNITDFNLSLFFLLPNNRLKIHLYVWYQGSIPAEYSKLT